MASGMIVGMGLALLTVPGPDDDPQPARTAVLASVAAPPIAISPVASTAEPIERRRMLAAIAAFRVTDRPTRSAETMRIAASRDSALDPLPGDRTIDIGNLDYRQQRRSAPTAAVDARMSMRLDPGQQSDPAFAMGGIGGALMRVTSALID